MEWATNADVAQLVEQLICNQLVGGSSPSIGSAEKRHASSLQNIRGDTRAVKWGRL